MNVYEANNHFTLGLGISGPNIDCLRVRVKNKWPNPNVIIPQNFKVQTIDCLNDFHNETIHVQLAIFLIIMKFVILFSLR